VSAEPIRLNVYIECGHAGGDVETTFEIPRDEWDAMTPDERDAYCNDTAEIEFGNRCSYGWNVEGAEVTP
jgi:hypothetical protein